MELRNDEKAYLCALFSGHVVPAAVAVHGAPQTGKSHVLREALELANVSFSFVQCETCVTVRVLLQRALTGILAKTEPSTEIAEHLDSFVGAVKSHFEKYNYNHVVVLDRVDRCHESHAQLLSCLPRLFERDAIQNVCVVFVYSTPEPKYSVSLPCPRVYFARYTLGDIKQILRSKLDLPGANEFFRSEFISVLVATFSTYAGSDIRLLERLALKLWPPFIRDADLADFSAHYRERAHLFTSNAYLDFVESGVQAFDPETKYLLCAAYLASYNQPRYDLRFFSKAKLARAKRRDTRPKKAIEVPSRCLDPPAFELERLFAIFHAIHPDGDEFLASFSTGTRLAELVSRGLLVKLQPDQLDSRTRWKVGVPFGLVVELAHEVGFNLYDYLLEE